MYVFEKYNDCDELRLIFDRLAIYKLNIFFIFLDNQQPYSIQKVVSVEKQLMFSFRYDVPFSLKTATQVSRQGGKDPIYYKITDTTHIAKVPMKRLLSHVNTKVEPTQFLARKTLEKAGSRVTVERML